LTWVVRIIWGENGADLGSGRGPWTVQVSFNPEVEREARPGVAVLGDLEASSSRYAEPEAEGVTPVFKTAKVSLNFTLQEFADLHIFLRTFGCLVLFGRSACSFGFLARHFEKTGAAVPPKGPLTLLRSVILDQKSGIRGHTTALSSYDILGARIPES